MNNHKKSLSKNMGQAQQHAITTFSHINRRKSLISRISRMRGFSGKGLKSSWPRLEHATGAGGNGP